ncbi:3-hydroxyacyl-CoA dehydrogenase NAD-binding domain-containing protein [Croceicoccus sediminis]|uniref:3-hydroxyacyl-CoA dehydrogenase NAD-binding domain-containing protein n=1 Tax=Croceicoccus sediminis TaxID=2571150 RepID=UPI001181CDED|nr:3-hydroxyacyl-CoA dehydrogenase NAD-binding domain-containing protein [Croceicoccus sediminis]
MNVFERLEGAILHLQFSNPPVNALSVGAGLVGALHDAIAKAVADPDVAAIVLSGAEGRFSAGADLRDFDNRPERLDRLRDLFTAIEASPKPVIAAIEGLCIGGGLELAIAAHYRVAADRARFAFPEISLGLLPGAGGTQRAPRLCGASHALDLILSGKQISAARALEIGIIDHVADDPVAEASRLFARGTLNAVRPSGEMAVPADVAEAVEAARQAKSLSLAALRAIACVEVIDTVPFEQGLSIEAKHFAELLDSRPSKALRHGFFGRREVARIPGAAKVEARRIDSVTVVGGGLMGTGIAIALLDAGLNVTLVEPRDEGRANARKAIMKTFDRNVEKGRLGAEVAAQRKAALSTCGTLEEAGEADLYIEAVFEDMAVKREVFTALDRIAPPHAILASNTSTLDVDAIAAFTGRPQNVVGLHFFSPANVMRLLEIVRGARTSPETLTSAMAFARQVGKTGVVAGVCDGFIGNRIFEEYLRQAWFLLEEGALPQQVDGALEAFGMAMGPCRVMDLAGQDIGWSIRKRRAAEQPDRPYSRVPDLVCEMGRFGQKTGAGFYLYPDGRTPQIDPEIEQLILAESERIGIERREIDDKEIVERCIYAMVNEGARIVAEGIAYRPVDIDIIYLDGYGFPAERGGPMFHADQQGLATVLDTIVSFAAGLHGWAWEPAPMLVDLVERGETFASLNCA